MTLLASVIWAVLELWLFLFPVYWFGFSSVDSYFFLSSGSGQPSVVPVGWVVVGVSFVCTFILADIGAAFKALMLSEVVTFVASLVILIFFPVGGLSLSTANFVDFFGLLAVFFFIAGVTGAAFGSLLGSYVNDIPGERIVRLNRHASFSLVLILVLAVSLSLLGVQSAIAAEVGLTNTVILADQTLTWNAGAQRVWANFTGGYGRGWLDVTWNSNTTLAFHYLISPASNNDEYVARPYCSPGLGCQGNSYVLLDNLPRAAAAWFQIENCPMSGCPSGGLYYKIQYR